MTALSSFSYFMRLSLHSIRPKVVMKRFQILFVCAGNICRSPLAEGIFRHIATNAGRAAEFNIGSTGTGGWHQGDTPDPRSIAVAAEHGIDISRQSARRVTSEDFDRFDLILAMDHDNLRNLLKIAPCHTVTKIRLFNSYASGTDDDIPDPYYGGREGFAMIYTMLFTGCSSLLAAAGKVRAS
jgi:protein-tyrosine phosphatase